MKHWKGSGGTEWFAGKGATGTFFTMALNAFHEFQMGINDDGGENAATMCQWQPSSEEEEWKVLQAWLDNARARGFTDQPGRQYPQSVMQKIKAALKPKKKDEPTVKAEDMGI